MKDKEKCLWELFSVKTINDERGALSILEYCKDFSFLVKRVFWISSVENESIIRGKHAHKELKQILFVPQGSCKIALESTNGIKEEYTLKPGHALFLDGLVWRYMHDFTKDCSLIVLVDRVFDEDYVIRNYREFQTYE
jgi:dTDP-4-dehydrorhamnose 3,5-epimerase-like enzyme